MSLHTDICNFMNDFLLFWSNVDSLMMRLKMTQARLWHSSRYQIFTHLYPTPKSSKRQIGKNASWTAVIVVAFLV